MRNDKKIHSIRYVWFVILYTIAFLLCIAVIFSPFFVEKRSLVWRMDGWTQHLKALIYYSDWLQEIVRTIFREGKLILPQWSERIGYGSDIIATLHYYVIGDPLTLFSVFVPNRYMVGFYDFMVIIRIYLIGISFSIYCFYMGQKEVFSVWMGSLIYSFCGYALIYGLHHPFFMNPMIYLPLILTGVEKIIKAKRPFLFMFMIFISVVSNFYFFYMLAILTALYTFFRIWGENQFRAVKTKVLFLFQMMLYGLVGVLSGACILFPVLSLFFEGNRMKAGYHFSLWYGSSFYHNFLRSFVSLTSAGNQTMFGYALVTLPAIALIFCQRRKYTVLKAGWILLTVCLLIPKVGEVMNGFSYPSNRWCFGYSMLVSYMVVVAGSICFKRKTGWQMICAAGVIVNLCYNGLACYSSYGNHVSQQYKTLEEAHNIRQASADHLIEKYLQEENEEDFFRYSGRFSVLDRNSSLLSGLASTTYYWSMADGKIDDYFQQMETRISSDYNYRELDGRYALNELANVRYFITPSGASEKSGVPYGYRKIIQNNKEQKMNTKYSIYKNMDPLPLGYTYDGWISKEKYQCMNGIEKQNALLQGVVPDREEKLDSQFEEAVIEQDSKKIPYQLNCGNGVRKSGNHFIVTKKKAEVILTFEGTKMAETYLYLKGFHYKKKNEAERQIPSTKNEIVLKMTAKTKDGTEIKKKLPYKAKNNIRYNNRHDFLVNFGYGDEEKISIMIRFPKEGEYVMEGLEVICQPVDHFHEYVASRKEDVLENVVWSPNIINGNISLKKKKILCFSIPYSKGWEIYVDGKKKELLKVNTMFMAVPLEKGQHQITLQYHTPGSRTGSMISLMGLSLMIWLSRKKRAQFQT